MKNKLKGTICIVLISVLMGGLVASCENGFDENEFLEKQAELAETKAQQDHQRALDLINAQLQSTLTAMEAQANYDQELMNLQAMIAQELENLKASLKVKEDSTSAANMLQAYRNAGLVNEYRVRFENSGEPVQGVSASISGSSGMVVSNESGELVFDDVIVGVNVLNITSDDYLDINLNLLFEPRTVIAVGSTAVVVPSYSSSVINLIKSGDNLETAALVKGKVSIESDLTNDSPELVQSEELEIYVDFNAAVAKEMFVVSEQSVSTVSFNFAEGNLGRASIDFQAGTYEMYLPVEGSADYELKVSELTIDQTIASKDGYVSVPTVFTAGSFAAEDIPEVKGVSIATSNEPLEPGAGLAFKYTPVARSLGLMLIPLGNPVEQYNTTFWIEDQGDGYRTSPLVHNSENVNVGFGVMEGYIESLKIKNKGQNYSNASLVISVQGTTLNDVPFDVEIIDFELDVVNGGIPSTIVVPDNVDGSGAGNKVLINNGKITGFTAAIVGDGAGADLDVVMNLQLFGVVISDPAKYAEAPEYRLVAQNEVPKRKASLKVSNFKRYFNIEIDNSKISVPYYTTPESLDLRLENGLTTSTIQYNGLVQQNVEFNQIVRLDGQGGLKFDNAGVYTTLQMFVDEPVIIETPRGSQGYEFSWDINDAGGITNFQIHTQGSGYSEEFSVVVAPRFNTSPGAGGAVSTVLQVNQITGEFTIANFGLTNPGSGYLENLNQATKDSGYGNGVALNIKPGETKVVDIRLGTGVRLNLVEGDNQ